MQQRGPLRPSDEYDFVDAKAPQLRAEVAAARRPHQTGPTGRGHFERRVTVEERAKPGHHTSPAEHSEVHDERRGRIVRVVYGLPGEQFGGASDSAENILEIGAWDLFMSHSQPAQINMISIDGEFGCGP
jgi:hypothetical protein